MLYEQTGVNKYIDVVVQGCETYTIVLALHGLVKRLDAEMSRIGINLIKNCKPLRSFPQRVLLQIVFQNIVWRQPFLFHLLIVKFIPALGYLYVAVSLAHKVLAVELLSIVVAMHEENVAQLLGILA